MSNRRLPPSRKFEEEDYMKKLIAIAVVFVLVAGAAFAADVSGTVIGTITPLKGDNAKDAAGDATPVGVGGNMSRIRIEVSGQDEDGKFGGYVRHDTNWWGAATPAITASGNVWWKPIDQFKLLVGGNGKDGFFGADGVTRWGFYQVAGDVGVASEGWAFGASFYEGFAPLASAVLTLTPIEALEINVGIPFFGDANEGGGKAEDVYNKIEAQVAYNIDGIGRVALSYKGDSNEGLRDTSKMFVYFGLSAIENLGIDIGLGFKFPGSESVGGVDSTYNAPLAVGLGVKFDAGAFGVKARLQGQFGEVTKVGSTETKGDTVINVDVLPYFAVSDNLTAFLSAGLGIKAPDGDDAVTSWHINPYITVKSNWWAPNFYAGLRIDSDGKKGSSGDGDASLINWSVPIGLIVSF
jgi:opacity protein-like surface antigen